MTARRQLRAGVGLTRVNVPMYSSEPGYVAAMNQAIKVMEDELLDVMAMWELEASDVMVEALAPTMAKAIEYCPKKTGELADSAYLDVIEFRGAPKVELGFAKGGVPRYAVYVHEIPSSHPAPTSYKFLERAVMEDLNGIYNRIAEAYARRLGA